MDPKDVMLRNFGRPVQAVALSPDYKTDRSYLSGGLAGNLVLTTGGRSGTSSTSSTTGGAVASASGWLGSIGLSANTGKDLVLHSGEGAISTIKWSLSGDYVAWVNEQGIKIMRSSLHLESAGSELAWKRISHIDHPNRPGWDEMAGTWKARLEWVDESGLEVENEWTNLDELASKPEMTSNGMRAKNKTETRNEKLVVGWSGTIWIINVLRGDSGLSKELSEKKAGKAEVVTMWVFLSLFRKVLLSGYSLRIDCIISGISLYTPNLLIVLAYVTPEEEASFNPKTTKPGVHRRRNALQPEMRIIDITTKEEVSVADQLPVSRFETLSATDYHLGVLPAMRISTKAATQRGALEALGGGIEAIGGGLWDATMYPARMFTGAASVRSGSPSSSKAASDANTQTSLKASALIEAPHPSTLAHGMKVFIHSPYDCIIAIKPTLADHLAWLDSHSSYEQAWNLLDQHPEAASVPSDQTSESPASTPSKTKESLLDFFEDDPFQSNTSEKKSINTQADREKRRIGEKWIQQLVTAKDWNKAGRVAGQVLQSSSSWEHWVWVFAQAHKYDELAPFIPTTQLRPPLPSTVYELMLGHYISDDPLRFSELLERWPPELYSPETVIEALQSKIRFIEARKGHMEDDETARDWRLLSEGLAKLYIAIARPRKALGLYIRLQDADAAMDLIASNHLVSALSDDIPGFILLRVSKIAQLEAPMSELATLTLEPIRLLVSEAYHGNVLPDAVITQLEKKFDSPNPYLYFYFRALWHGDSAPALDDASSAQKKSLSSRAQAAEERLLVQEGKSLVSDHADIAIAHFAEYDRDLLMAFLKSGATYNLSLASRICAQRDYTPELVFLLSKEGRTTEALRLIIDRLDDVSQAIEFAKDQNDASLWDDLLDYAMNKPRFIRGLLEEVGTSIDPLKLVKRIPLGLEIEGLRDGLARMLKEYEVQESIGEGVARVLRGEVHQALQQRSQGTRKGIKFDVASSDGKAKKKEDKPHLPRLQKSQSLYHSSPSPNALITSAGHCAACGTALNQRSSRSSYLIAFPCTHVFHVSCLLRYNKPADYEPPAHYSLFDLPSDLEEEEDEQEELIMSGIWDQSIGPKVDHAALLRDIVQDLGGCPLEDGSVNAR